MLDDHRRKAVTAVGDFGHRASLPSAALPSYPITLTKPTKAPRQLGRTGIGHAPIVLQGRLAQPQSSPGSDHPQFVPTPLEHWCSDLDPAVTQLQARTLGGDGEGQSAFDCQSRLRPSMEQLGLNPNDDRAGFG